MGFLTGLRRIFEKTKGKARETIDHSFTISARDAPVKTDRRTPEELRQALAYDPNDAAAFFALVEIVSSHAPVPADDDLDPLTAAAPDPEALTQLAVWSLGEELAGNPIAWFPLVQLARLSLADDTESALRRLTTACERDPSGQALVAAMVMLREAQKTHDAFNIGVGQGRVRDQIPEVGLELVRTALALGRIQDAQTNLELLAEHPQHNQIRSSVAELRQKIDEHGV